MFVLGAGLLVCLIFSSYWGQAGWIPGCTGSDEGGRTVQVSYMCTAPVKTNMKLENIQECKKNVQKNVHCTSYENWKKKNKMQTKEYAKVLNIYT